LATPIASQLPKWGGLIAPSLFGEGVGDGAKELKPSILYLPKH